MDLIRKSIEHRQSLIPLFSLILGLATSLHCLGMCGPLAILYGKKKSESTSYHLGRLAGYFSIGSIFILFSFTVETYLGKIVGDYLVLGMGAFFFLMGLFYFFPSTFKMRSPFVKLSFLHRKFGKTGAFGLGLSSVFLPCGFLYTFFLALLGMEGKFYAFLSIFTFWLGTLPALSFAQVIAKKFFQKAGLRAKQMLACIFIFVGLLTIYGRSSFGMAMLSKGHTEESEPNKMLCHE